MIASDSGKNGIGSSQLLDQARDERPDMCISSHSPGTIHGTIQKMAEATPDATALIHNNVPTTYRQLDQLADVYAAELSALGIAAGAFLPVCLPRSVRLVGVLLAALKLGAAYVLIDPAWPSKRIRDEFDQLKPTVFVTDSAAPEGIPVILWSPPALKAEEAARALTAKKAAAMPEVPPEAACCVFFTSGTSGRPKGAISPHSGTMRMVGLAPFADLGSRVVMAQGAALPWDLFNLEQWTPLLVGGTSILVDEPFLSSTLLRELITENGKNTAWLTTSLFNMLVDEDLGCFTGLRTVIIGGEKLSPSHVRTFLTAHPDIAVINGYGPVESTIFISTWRIGPDDCDIDGGIPIGTPCPQTSVFIMRDNEECPDGEVGELCVAGAGLALGYLGEPKLTEKKFPMLRLRGHMERVYRTGDLAFRDSAGILHYRGRADRQLKVRGHRIEPGEIEAILGMYPAVTRAVVLPRYSAEGAAVGLTAFYTTHHGLPVSQNAIDAYLRARLAAYQIPDFYIHRLSMPLTPYGKLDVNALQAVALEAAAAHATETTSVTHVAPAVADPILRTVVDVVACVLPLARVTLDETFTELGATSLDTGRICARLSEILRRPVPVSQAFRMATARTLAAWIRETMPLSATYSAALVKGDAVALSPIQTGLLMEHLMYPDRGTSHCTIGWRIEGRLDRAALSSALKYVHDRHGMLNCIFEIPMNPQIRPFGQPVPALRALIADTAEEALKVLDQELARPFRLTAGHTWHPVYIELRSEPVTFLGIAVHHAVFDGVSASILANDLAAAYNAYQKGSAPDLEPAPSPAEIAIILESRLRYLDLDAQRAYWERALAGMPVLEYPVDTDPTPEGRATDPRVEAVINAKLARAVDKLADAHAVTPFNVYLAAYTQTMTQLTGQIDFGIGTPFNHRSEPALDRAVSCLVDFVCIRPAINPGSSPAEAIAVAARASADAFSVMEVPLEWPSIGQPQLFQTSFVLQESPALLPLEVMHSVPLLPRATDIASELAIELFPSSSGVLHVMASYQPDRVSSRFVHDLVDSFISRLNQYVKD